MTPESFYSPSSYLRHGLQDLARSRTNKEIVVRRKAKVGRMICVLGGIKRSADQEVISPMAVDPVRAGIVRGRKE